MRAIAIITVRVGSMRLPGKVRLKPGDETVLDQVKRQAKACRWGDQVEVATADFSEGGVISTGGLLKLLSDHPELARISAHVDRKKLGV